MKMSSPVREEARVPFEDERSSFERVDHNQRLTNANPLALGFTLAVGLALSMLTITMTSCGDSGTGTVLGDGSTDSSFDSSSETDATSVDNDGDQYPSDVDCDDNDENVYPGVTRACSSDCFEGTETCLETGQWSPCTASTDCDCTQPGDTRVVDCGNCGQASQECGLDLKWELPGQCMNEGECGPGKTETEPCPFCGTTRSRICSQECEWLEWDESNCHGVCSPGPEEVTSDGCTDTWELQLRQCDATCEWQTLVACGDCIIPPRTGTSDYSDEICVPAGPFVMGSDPGEGYPDEEPEHTVILTAYLIDKYEVSNARYRTCVEAGVCTEPGPYNPYWLPGTEDHPVGGMTYDQAMTFCQWDGGRTLPTEAQWEKAARGPAPREVGMPWGEEYPTCDLVAGYNCSGSDDIRTFPVYSHLAGASYYGVHHLAGNVEEWCQDYYSANYYSVSPLVDPPGPMSGTQRVMRGGSAIEHLDLFVGIVASRWLVDNGMGIRCARQAY